MTKAKASKEAPWTSADLAFQVVKPGTLSYDKLTRETAIRGHASQDVTLLYDSVALRYNMSEPGDLLVLNLPNKPVVGNLRKIFSARGLTESDFRLFQPMRDADGNRYEKADRPIVLQRITGKEMRTVQPYPSAAARLAKEAEARGEKVGLLHQGKSVNPGPAEQISAESQELVNT